MLPKFICHPDFSDLTPRNVFCKEDQVTPEQQAPSEQVNRHVLFRRKITLEKIERAIINISADDYYKLYINGRFVTQGPAPSYPSYYFYNQIDVSEYLHRGENTIAVHTYYQGLVNRVWISGDNRQMLWLRMSVDGQDVLVSDESWRCTDHTGYEACGTIGYSTIFAEFYHSAAPEVGFELPDFDDSSWGYAAVYKNADHKLVLQPTPQLVFEDILPAKCESIDGGLRIDFGREAAGYLYARARGKRGDVLTLRYGEELCDDGSVRYNMRCNSICEEKWELSGGDDTLNQFDYKGFRYAEILFPDGVEVYDIKLIARHYPFEQVAKYDTDNEDMRRILKLCSDTIRYGVQEVFVDCPTREKGQYLGDVSISGRALSILTGDTAMMKKAILDFCHTAFICPGIMAISCASFMQEIADYTLQFPAQVVWVYRMDGDEKFLREVEPYLMGLYEFLLGYENEDGLLEDLTEKWNLVDWPWNLRDNYAFDLERPQQKGRGVHNVLCAFWCGYLDAMDEYLTLIGKSATGKTERAKQAFVRKFYSEQLGLFCDTPELSHAAIQSNVLPLMFDIGTQDASLTERICAFIEKKRLTCMGTYMAFFTLSALVNHGRRDLAEQLALDEGCWKNMLSEGATTVFEAWGKRQKSNCSLFHPWSTAPVIVFSDTPRIY